MKAPRLLPLAATAAALVLTACEAQFGNDVVPQGNGSAENKAEEGQVSINASGVQMRINIPEGLRHETSIHDDQLAIRIILLQKRVQRLRHVSAPVVRRHDAGHERPFTRSKIKVDFVAQQRRELIPRS